MSIIRHEIRQISQENRDQPTISQAVVHGNVAYFAGITPNPIVGDIKTQTAQVLRRVDELLKLAGTDKSHLLSAQVWIAGHASLRRSQFCLERVGRSGKPSGTGLPHDRLLATRDAR
jgi:enamine deaminase RidA (YjgF/YER057c/UK114 family)